jgi:excisionase family DNA binding protein
MKENMLDYEEVSKRIGFPVGTLRTWKMQGRLEGIKFGSRVKFPESYIEELIKKGVPPKNGSL